jgi:uncharacterized membrane protein
MFDAEDFCGFNAYGFPSSTACVPFLWQDGVMTKLATLGGENGFAYTINNRGQVAGLAETAMKDPFAGCAVHRFKPVVWANGKIYALPTFSWRYRLESPRPLTIGVRLRALQAHAHPSIRIAGSISPKITPWSGKTARGEIWATSAPTACLALGTTRAPSTIGVRQWVM